MADKERAAACGLFCRACTLYIGTMEEPARLIKLAAVFGADPEDLKCEGCRSERVGPYCRQCKMVVCADKKGVEFCSLCDEYPCADLQAFQATMPHRIELWNDLARLKEVGGEQWLAEKADFYACPDCRTINSTYDLKCRRCDREPSCAYTERHGDAVRSHIEHFPKWDHRDL